VSHCSEVGDGRDHLSGHDLNRQDQIHGGTGHALAAIGWAGFKSAYGPFAPGYVVPAPPLVTSDAESAEIIGILDSAIAVAEADAAVGPDRRLAVAVATTPDTAS
jgi:hypothetical protein